jgi:hypothetical protein
MLLQDSYPIDFQIFLDCYQMRMRQLNLILFFWQGHKPVPMLTKSWWWRICSEWRDITVVNSLVSDRFFFVCCLIKFDLMRGSTKSCAHEGYRAFWEGHSRIYIVLKTTDTTASFLFNRSCRVDVLLEICNMYNDTEFNAVKPIDTVKRITRTSSNTERVSLSPMPTVLDIFYGIIGAWFCTHLSQIRHTRGIYISNIYFSNVWTLSTCDGYLSPR